MAAGGARAAAADDACDRIPQWSIGRTVPTAPCWIPQWTERNRLFRRPERGVRNRYADGQYDRLPALATDLVSRRVSVIVATAGTPTIRAAKAATSSIPIVVVIGGDPVTFGIVASLNRPSGNITGMTLSGSETVAKRLGLMLELVPAAGLIAFLANPKNPISESQLTELRAAARKLDRQLLVLSASTESDFAAVSKDIDQHHVDALFVAADHSSTIDANKSFPWQRSTGYRRAIPGATLWWMAD